MVAIKKSFKEECCIIYLYECVYSIINGNVDHFIAQCNTCKYLRITFPLSNAFALLEIKCLGFYVSLYMFAL